MVTKEEAIKILEDEGLEPGIIQHCKAVSREATKIAKIIKARGTEVDVGFVEVASLLHDIGRAHSHGIDHGVIGSSILRSKGHLKFANAAERHIGAGITSKEASALGLPEKDMVPKTIEEKIIAYADNIVVEDEIISMEQSISKFEKKLGKNSSAVKRLRALSDEISSLM